MKMIRKIHLKFSNLRQIFSFLGFTIILFLLISFFSPSRVLAAPAGCWPAASCCNEDCSSCCSSFLPGTDITIDQNGTTADIEKLKVGDTVLSFIESTNQIKVNKLVAIRKSVRDYYFIVTAKELTSKKELNVKASANHPFYVANNYQSWDPVVPRGYKRTDELEIGNKVYVLNEGNKNLSEAIISQIERVDKPTEVYSLTVENESNYFAEKFAVHNKFCSPDFCGWDPPSCYESDCNGTNCDTQGACAAASTCWADSPCYCSPVDNSQCCDSREGEQCGSYGCCENMDGTGAEGTCIKKYNCSGSCEFSHFVPDGCGNGQCECGETAGNCAADCDATPKYKCSGASCVRDDVNGNFDTSNCNNTCTAVIKYKCSGASCVRDDVNGNYSTSNCDNACTSGSCTNTLTMNAAPNPVVRGNNMTFTYSDTAGGQSSLCVADTLTGGVGVGVPDARSCASFDTEYPMNRTCVTATAGTFNWTHYWWYNSSCPAIPSRCNKTIFYTISTPSPTFGPWIQVTGDVHANTVINATGGP